MNREEWLSRLEAERTELVLPRFDEDAAWTLGCKLRGRAAAESHPVAIEVARPGHRLFHVALPGAMPDNAAWIHRKRNVVERFLDSSLLVALRCEVAGTTLTQKFRLNEQKYVHSGGGVAIRVMGVGVVGSVTVSGLTQYDDHALAAEALAKLRDGMMEREDCR